VPLCASSSHICVLRASPNVRQFHKDLVATTIVSPGYPTSESHLSSLPLRTDLVSLPPWWKLVNLHREVVTAGLEQHRRDLDRELAVSVVQDVFSGRNSRAIVSAVNSCRPERVFGDYEHAPGSEYT